MKVKVRCMSTYHDAKLGCMITPKEEDKNYERVITKERADEIIKKTSGAIKIIETIKEETIETAKLDVETEKAIKKPVTKKAASTKKKLSK